MIKALQVDAPACLVSVESTQGSVPREAGAWMAVLPGSGGALGHVVGTIGGGHLELEAIQIARNLLVLPEAADELPDEEGMVRRWALGPSLGQCCGGLVHLRFELVRAEHAQALQKRLMPSLHPLALFGGGHVGAAIVNALAPLPFAVQWIDSRDSVFPDEVPIQVRCEHSDPVEAAVRDLPSGARVLIMSFSHAEDLNIVAACLKRQREQGDLPFVGLIGSATKRAVFTSRLRQRGFDEHEIAHITCPIGVPGITGKEPEVIAVAVAAQLLQSVYASPQ
ncbi:xanthine dehydrogenase accessory protein XdhC [Diaphorobacter sp. HDW4B]|nr:xanthine dehydrogenase accessory protein XdhC [Diaphorobacter sp. HDW4B]